MSGQRKKYISKAKGRENNVFLIHKVRKCCSFEEKARKNFQSTFRKLEIKNIQQKLAVTLEFISRKSCLDIFIGFRSSNKIETIYDEMNNF